MNIYDIAKACGVSITTVSRVINDTGRVSEETKQRVKKVMEELNYTPSQVAVGLATNTSKTIGIMVPDVRDSFHADIAYQIESKMVEHGYNCILCNTRVENDQDVDYLNTLHSKNVDGIILVGSSFHGKRIHAAYEKWHKKIPVVLINAEGGEGTASVLCDEEEGIRQALEHLKAQGRIHPAFIKNAAGYQSRSSYTKGEAFLKACTQVYGEDRSDSVFICKPGVEEYYGILDQLQKAGIDAVLFTSDLCGALFLKALEQAGKQAPGDYALVGFNNGYIATLTTPSLTTIDHMVEQHCQAAVEKLLDMIDGEKVEAVTKIKPQLVVRDSA